MEIVTVNHLSFSYPETTDKALDDISFSVNQGDFLTICGASGSGKSTLLRLLKPSLSPHGTISGEILFHHTAIRELSHRLESEKIGFVQQSPENQLVTDKVWHELAFGPESLGWEQRIIRRRVAETASFFGIDKYFESDVATLSGGQKQLLNLAAVMIMHPEVLILDEPTAQLDPIAAADFFACLHRINKELGTTVIISEHRLEPLMPLCSRVVVLENGRILADNAPNRIGQQLAQSQNNTFQLMPAPMRIVHEVAPADNYPVTVAESRDWLRHFVSTHEILPLFPEAIPPCGEVVFTLKNIWFRYQKDSADILKNLSIDLKKGELVAILGGNGAGKSTLLSVINGIAKAYRGKRKAGVTRIATLPQNPRLLLSGNTVQDSLYEVLEQKGLTDAEKSERFHRTVTLCHLEHLLTRHPFDLSGGETQRAALAKLLLTEPQMLLLDEPTKGVDGLFKEQFASILQQLCGAGTTIVMVSHDLEFCAQFAHRCLMLFNGELTAEGTPRDFFSSNTFYVTSARRMSEDILADTVTAEEIIYCCTGKKKPPELPDRHHDCPSKSFSADKKSVEKLPFWKKFLAVFGGVSLLFGILVNLEIIRFSFPFWVRGLLVIIPAGLLMLSLSSLTKKNLSSVQPSKLSKRTMIATIIILLTIPVTIFIGTVYLDDQRYLFISLLVLLECMLPFFLIFEGRKPQPKELVIIAVMCAVTVAGRSVFAALPQIKPVLALIIISGVAFGAESGFMVGAVTMLVSNIYFGQGAWTPWQMFAAGIIGYVAGILYQKGFLRRSRNAMCVFGFIVTILIYGLIMNFSTIVLTRVPITWESLLAFYAQGLPFDIIHAFSTMTILFFAAEPMLRKLDRVKTKYGLLQRE